MAIKKVAPSDDQLPVPAPFIERHIYIIRGQRVMLDSDLAELYQVLTKNLNLAARRNIQRFPEDFMFQLTQEEARSLRLQLATSNWSFYIFTRRQQRQSDWNCTGDRDGQPVRDVR